VPPAPPARLTRRGLLACVPALALSAALPRAAAAGAMLPAGQAFGFDILSDWMRAAASRPYMQPVPVTGFAAGLDYDSYRLVQFRRDRTRWADDPAGIRLQAFHTGWLFGEPVQMFDVSGGTVEPMAFGTGDFEYLGELAAQVPQNADLPGVAGFRLLAPLNRPDRHDEVVAFLGASYFRALGRGSAYGISARGLALNTAAGEPEEFPRFTAFYLERPPPGAPQAAFSAALDSPSVTGAFRFVLRPGETTEIEVTARLFFRGDVGLVGMAPLTSMFLHDGKNRAGFDDYRPQVHDSEGLRLVRADGDVLWRPLNNPPRLADSWFSDPVVRWGLDQRTRDFASYQDAGAQYERRPSLQVEPLGDWGAGAVRLVELPTDLETNDNIVAMWVPAAQGAAAGEAREYSYRLHWGDLEAAGPLARVVATRAGEAGVAGVAGIAAGRKFVIDFAGGPLAQLPPDAAVTAAVSLSDGRVTAQVLQAVPQAGLWRLVIDAAPPAGGLAEMSAHLAGYGRKLSETWLYQWIV
jgi:glucans biosynthesis protein